MLILPAFCPALLCCAQTKASSARAELGKRLQVRQVAAGTAFTYGAGSTAVCCTHTATAHFGSLCNLPLCCCCCCCRLGVSWLCCAAHVKAVQTKWLQIAAGSCMWHFRVFTCYYQPLDTSLRVRCDRPCSCCRLLTTPNLGPAACVMPVCWRQPEQRESGHRVTWASGRQSLGCFPAEMQRSLVVSF